MKYDLLLAGGDVLDPAGGLRGLMDIRIAGGKISAVAPSLAVDDLTQPGKGLPSRCCRHRTTC